MKEYVYEKARVAVDPVIFTIANGKLKVALQLREKHPFEGCFELMGGLLRENQTAEELLARKLKDVLGEKVFFRQFYTFTSPSRDPRGRTVSIGFIALVREEIINTEKQWFDIDSLPKIAFDHREITLKAYQYLQENLNSELVKQFLPARFPLNRLQKIHEIIKKELFDNRNFRKKMLASGAIEEANEIEKGVAHRPARLFRFTI